MCRQSGYHHFVQTITWEKLPTLVSRNGKELKRISCQGFLSYQNEREQSRYPNVCPVTHRPLSKTIPSNNSLWVRRGHHDILLYPKLTFPEGTAWHHAQCPGCSCRQTVKEHKTLTACDRPVSVTAYLHDSSLREVSIQSIWWEKPRLGEQPSGSGHNLEMASVWICLSAEWGVLLLIRDPQVSLYFKCKWLIF